MSEGCRCSEWLVTLSFQVGRLTRLTLCQPLLIVMVLGLNLKLDILLVL